MKYAFFIKSAIRGNDLMLKLIWEPVLKWTLLIEGKVIIELKSVETLALVHRYKQLLTYLKLTNLNLVYSSTFLTPPDINKSYYPKSGRSLKF